MSIEGKERVVCPADSENRLFDYHRKMRIMVSNMPIRKVARKMNTIVIGKIKKWKILMRGPYVSDKRFLNAFTCTHNSVGQMLDRFSERERRIFSLNTHERRKIVRIMKDLDVNRTRNLIEEADQFCAHVFDLLGSGPVKLITRGSPRIAQKEGAVASYEPIDRHTDFKSGTKWNPQTYYREIKMQRGADRRMPRELSRFYQVVTLEESYWYTGCEKFAKEFVTQTSDWIESNPPEFGINWQVTMDVAIRACNWIVGYCFFRDSGEITNEFLLKLLKSLYQHGRHVMANLEQDKAHTSNHYISDIVGLVYLGVMFPGCKEAKKWRKLGMQA